MLAVTNRNPVISRGNVQMLTFCVLKYLFILEPKAKFELSVMLLSSVKIGGVLVHYFKLKVKYFCKTLHFRCLTGFCVHLSDFHGDSESQDLYESSTVGNIP